MSTVVWPPLSPDQLLKAEQETLQREIQWLLASLQSTLASFKSGLEECNALLAPVEPGSTLVVSSLRSESVKGFITRVGTRIVKADIHLKLQTLPPPPRLPSYPLRLASEESTSPLTLPQLSTVRNLINQALDVVDISTWTGDAKDANFIGGQLRLLFELVQEARQTLKGGDNVVGPWNESPTDENAFSPPLPTTLALNLSISEASILLHFRTLHHLHPSPGTPTSSLPFSSDALPGLSLRQRLGLAARLPDHDEHDVTFIFRGGEVKVREKLRVETPDPSLMAAMAKLSALEHGIKVARRNLGVLMGQEDD